MIAAALQVIPQTWPNLLHPHPWAVGLFVLTGAVMFGYAALGHKESGGTANYVGRDNFGDQNHATAGRDAYSSGTHTHYPSPLPESSLRRVPEKEVPLNISFASLNVVYHQSPGAWFSAQEYTGEPHFALVALINNPVPPEGQIAVDTSSISAHIRFSVEDHWESEIPRAYWIGRAANMVDIQ